MGNIVADNQNKTLTEHFGSVVANLIQPGDLIFLRGDIGVGKTTCVQGIIRKLLQQPKLIIKSPTFCLLNVYSWQDKANIYHLDLYRLRTKNDIISLNLPDLLDQNNVVIVEWPSLLEADNQPNISIEIVCEEETRIYRLTVSRLQKVI